MNVVYGVMGFVALMVLCQVVADWLNPDCVPGPRRGHRPGDDYPGSGSFLGRTPEDNEFARVVDREHRKYWSERWR